MTTHVLFGFIWIICTLTMSFDVERGVFELDLVDGNSLNEFVKKYG